jgi:hypothetical protein
MIESEFLQLIAQFGFPIALSIYLLVVQNRTIMNNTDALNRLNLTLEKQFFRENVKEENKK